MTVLVLAVLTGCSSWIDQEADCEYAIYDWSDDLLAYILAGDGSGAFELDPVDAPRTTISGEYAADDGDYEYDVEYDDDYWLKEQHVEGFGTVFHNGNLDLKHSVSSRDVLGETWAMFYRIQRNECEMAIASWADGDEANATTITGEYEDDTSFAWDMAYPGYTIRGGWDDTLAEWQLVAADDGTYRSESQTDPEEGETSYEYSAEGYQGSAKFRWDGSIIGEITFTDDGVTCTYGGEYGDDECTYKCDGYDDFTDVCAS